MLEACFTAEKELNSYYYSSYLPIDAKNNLNLAFNRLAHCQYSAMYQLQPIILRKSESILLRI
tara:strand:- start:4 stop:192 length:189 start_codon:yes stop_codon:yes gene_type:complete